jgi:phage tail sheath protein FI
MAYSRPGVYVSEGTFATTATVGTTTVAAGFVGTSARGPVVPTKITSWTSYKALYGDIEDAYDLPYAVYHFFANGGRTAYVSRVYDSSAAASASANLAGTVDGGGSATVFNLRAENAGAWGNSLTATVTAGLVTGNEPTFNLVIKLSGTEVERWNEVSLDPDANRYLPTVVNTYSTYVRVSSVATYTTSYTVTAVSNSALASGSNGSGIANADWNDAVDAFDAVTEELLINMVGMTTAAVVNNALTYCETRGDCFLVIDPTTVTAGADALTAISAYNASSYGAVYYPKLKMVDPSKTGSAAIRETYPGGAILGLYSRVEAERTVAKAPAGYAYDLRGALGLATSFTEAEQGTLYDAHINTLKAIPGAGVIVNGARTLKKTDITKFIPTRRSLNYVKAQAKRLTEFAVFEPNNERLWTNIQVRLSKFLADFWASGGLKGRNANEAFYIVCDSTNNTSNSIENGEVRVEVGVALQTPAEFIVIEVSQFTGGSTLNETI